MTARIVPLIQAKILLVRDQRVMLDSHLADLYGVETRALVQQVQRNINRFPGDFMFRLSSDEFEILKSQSVISSAAHGGRRTRPYVFTEHGVAMLSSVLRSDRAVAVNIEIMRAFVEMRQIAANDKELAKRIDELERATTGKLESHEKQLAEIFRVLRRLASPPSPKRKHPIGFNPPMEHD
jgi:hypothetical protein